MPPEFSFIAQIGVPAFVLRPDGHGRVVYAACNDLWLARTHLTQDEVCGRTAAEIFDGPVGRQCDHEHSRASQSSRRRGYEMPLVVKGTESTVKVSLNPVFDGSERLSHLLGLWIDVSPTSAARNAAATIEAFMPEMEAFVSFAAHDLRTPMRQVHSLAELLREDFEDLGDGKLELINMLEDVAVKASGLITDILSQTQASTTAESQTQFDLARLWDDIAAVIDPREHHVLVAPEMSLVTDRAAVLIALRNLIDNAIKHGQRERLALRLEVSETPDGMLLFEVYDNGMGFPDPAIAFLDGGKLRVESGYGLFGIKRLIHARGGTISAENLEHGKGSVVRFSLPGYIAASENRQAAVTH